MTSVPLYRKGQVVASAIVDDCDAEWANGRRWGLHNVKVRKDGSMQRYARRRSESMHKTILERKLGRPLSEGELPDHRDNDGLNNCRDNLRVADGHQNAANRRSGSAVGASGYLGVVWQPERGSYAARITVNGCLMRVGAFPTALEAAIARDQAALKYFGEFACLNFPRQSPQSMPEGQCATVFPPMEAK